MFATASQLLQCVTNLARQSLMPSMINWAIEVDNTSHGQPLVYHTDHQFLSIARFSRTGLSATADTFLHMKRDV